MCRRERKLRLYKGREVPYDRMEREQVMTE
jgi:hypothetical protein